MAFTKLYLTNRTAPYTPATLRGAWDDTAGVITKALDVEKQNGGLDTSVSRAETSTNTTFDVLLYRGISGKLAAQTITGTVDILTLIIETASDADLFWHIHLYVTQGDSDTPRGTLLTDYVENTTNEWPNSISSNRKLQSPQSLSSLAVSDGDRLVIEVGYIARNSTATSKSGILNYGTADSAGVPKADSVLNSSTSGAPFLTFSSSILESPYETRDSQIVVEIASEEADVSRVTELAVEVMADAGVATQRNSQMVVEVGAIEDEVDRVTQFLIEVMRGNALEIVISACVAPGYEGTETPQGCVAPNNDSTETPQGCTAPNTIASF